MKAPNFMPNVSLSRDWLGSLPVRTDSSGTLLIVKTYMFESSAPCRLLGILPDHKQETFPRRKLK